MQQWHSIWLDQTQKLHEIGSRVSPRDQPTFEMIDQHIVLHNSRENVLDVAERQLNYRFMVAEWLWMMFGHSDVETITQYNSIIKQFSDDGVSFVGAYGPHIGAQRPRIVDKLRRDPTTRQAVIEIPRPYNFPNTKDEPCTLSLQFFNRQNALHLIATMRSSDVWLGLPYDVFNFTMLQNALAAELSLQPGVFSLRMGSSHLYERDVHKALACLGPTERSFPGTLSSPRLCEWPPRWLDRVLVTRDASAIPSNAENETPEWFLYAHVLLATNNRDALALLRVASCLNL